MNTYELKIMSEHENKYWWHIGRLSIIEKQIEIIENKSITKPIKMLNIGCGTGGTIELLSRHSKELVNIDVSKEAIKYMKKGGHKATHVNGTRLPFKENTFDMIVALDVLEHIKDEDLALNEWLRVLKKDGSLLITVPAHKWLWSGHDNSLEHFRRYSKKSLTDKIESAGFVNIRSSYMIAFSFILIVGFRMITKIINKSIKEETSYVKVPNVINNMFISLLKIEAEFQKYFKMPLGTSIIAWYKK
jgi:SAM-dependent methyltransferase